MQAQHSTFGELLQGQRRYVIPPYQRNYAWDRRDWKTLADDLDHLLDHPHGAAHFVGSVVTVAHENVASAVRRFDVIDGQQRLTTVLLLLAALRDEAETHGPFHVPRAVQEMNLTNPHEAPADRPRLVPKPDDRDAFSSVTRDVEGPAVPGHSRITDAYAFFRVWLAGAYAGRLDEVRGTVLGRLGVVAITLGAEDNPHLIFESLNVKGKRLTQADLLRNYFLMRLPPEEAEQEFSGRWEPMERLLTDKLPDFFRHDVMQHVGGRNVRKDETYQEVRRRLDAGADGSGDVKRVLRDYARRAAVYRRLIRPTPNDPHYAGFSTLQRLAQTTSYPFLLAVHKATHDGRLPEAVFDQVVPVVENFTVRRLICGEPSNILRSLFGRLATDTADVHDSATFLEHLLATLARPGHYPTDANVRHNVLTRPIFEGQYKRFARLLLERLERRAAGKEVPDVASNAFSIEHVMPQKLSPAWKQHLGDTWRQDHRDLLHTLGNLTLTGYNSELSNLPWSDKRPTLETSNLALNHQLAKAEAWDGAAIRVRGGVLADAMLAEWPDLSPAGVGDATGVSTSGKAAPAPAPIAFILDGERIDIDGKATWWRLLKGVCNALYARFPVQMIAGLRTFNARSMIVEQESPPAAFKPRLKVGPIWVNLHGSSESNRDWAYRIAFAAGVERSRIVLVFDGGD